MLLEILGKVLGDVAAWNIKDSTGMVGYYLLALTTDNNHKVTHYSQMEQLWEEESLGLSSESKHAELTLQSTTTV